MSSLTNRSRTALLVVDVQRDVVGQAHDVDRVVANIAALVDQARAENAPVIWVQHEDENMPAGTEGWEIVHELRPVEGEPLVAKGYGDSFEATDLESILSEHLGSPLSPEQAIAYTNMYWSFSSAPDRICATVDTTDVDFGAV